MAKNKSVFNHIILTENVYIYQKPLSRFYSKATVNQIFKAVKDEKQDQGIIKLFDVVNQDGVTNNRMSYKISGVVFKFATDATFVDTNIVDWYELKLGYLFLIDFRDYIIIAKRNISGLKDLIDSLEPLPYEVISKMLYTATSVFEKYNMDNLEVHGSAVKNRTIIADNLNTSFNYTGVHTYTLNSLRIIRDNIRYAISPGTSRLSKSGEKVKLLEFVEWCSVIIDLAINFHDSQSPLDVFAKPYSYIERREELIANSVTLLFNRLLDDIENGVIIGARYVKHGYPSRPINLRKVIKKISVMVELEPSNTTYLYEAAEEATSPYKDLSVKLNPKSIVLHSPRLRNLRLYNNDAGNDSLIGYLNAKNSFIVTFDKADVKYTNRRLFRDSALLGSIENFLSVFEPDINIQNITTEKGLPIANSTHFDAHSAFYFTENKFGNSEFLILDDLGGEWADHIFINGLEIGFVHAKAMDRVFSASSFTEVVGQAQKNMGNLSAAEHIFKEKKAFWQSDYKLNKVTTSISRVRVGSNVDDFISRYIEIKNNINLVRSVHLVVNFMSKALLTTNLNNLRNGVSFPRKREAVQILWQISSLIATCRDHNVRLKIHCKP